MEITKGLIVDHPWIDLILDGEKTWEMRSTGTSHRGWFGLIAKGSGAVQGIARLVDVGPPLSLEEMLRAERYHRIGSETLRGGMAGRWNVPWKLADARRLPEPVPYRHSPGAVVWVALDADARAALGKATSPFANASPEPAPVSAETEPDASRCAAGANAEDGDQPSMVVGRTTLTAGNIRNGHIYLKDCLHAFPHACIGGPNASGAGEPLRLDWGDSEAIETDIDGEKKIFRKRGWARTFFRRERARPGDAVVISRIASRHYALRLERAEEQESA